MLNYLQTNTMKKLLLVLLFVPLITFGQTAEDFFNSCKAKDSLKDFKGAIIGFNKAIGIDQIMLNIITKEVTQRIV